MSERFRVMLQDGEMDELLYGDLWPTLKGVAHGNKGVSMRVLPDTVNERWHSKFSKQVDAVAKQPSDTPDQDAKRDAGKPRLFLVPPEAVQAIGKVMTFGCRKYGEGSWRNVEIWRYRDAMCRHLEAYKADPQGVDTESGMPHLWHLLCNAAFLVALEKQGA